MRPASQTSKRARQGRGGWPACHAGVLCCVLGTGPAVYVRRGFRPRAPLGSADIVVGNVQRRRGRSVGDKSAASEGGTGAEIASSSRYPSERHVIIPVYFRSWERRRPEADKVFADHSGAWCARGAVFVGWVRCSVTRLACVLLK